jgi:hypothetical protein
MMLSDRTVVLLTLIAVLVWVAISAIIRQPERDPIGRVEEIRMGETLGPAPKTEKPNPNRWRPNAGRTQRA